MTAENINLEELFKKHNTYIYNISIRLTHNKQDAEDLTQDVWIKIVNSINNFRQESNIKTWIYKIIYNTFLDNCQKYQKLEFDNFAKTMNAIEDCDIESHYEPQLANAIVEEAKIGILPLFVKTTFPFFIFNSEKATLSNIFHLFFHPLKINIHRLLIV